MSSKRSKKDGETKTEGDGDKKKSKSKKKEKASSKEPKEPKEPKEKAPVVEPPTTTLAPPPPVIEQPEINDPDAIQLFRRYDREKANHVTRSDFLDLLRDYTTWYPGRKWNMPVMPCALTDAAGVPLGFERTSRNSEFEAGQLFERYDTNRSGTLELGEFQLFFRDFKKQLAPFVDEMLAAFHATPPLSRMGFDSAGLPRRHPPTNSFGEPTTTNPWQQRPPNHDSSHRVFDTRHLYESKLDQLHALSEKTLRHLQLQMPHHHHNTSAPRWHDMDELERDLAFVDRIYTDTTKFMEQAHRVVSIEDMNAFLDEFPRMHGMVQQIAAKTYAPSPPVNSHQPTHSSSKNDVDRDKLVKVKDQMIWGLLQERNELRRQRDAIDAQFRHMTELSAQEMRKWAKLTDDMQAEIERLRG